MKGFLEEVAGDLYARYGEGLSERAAVSYTHLTLPTILRV